MTGKQNGKMQKSKFRSNRSSLESPQKEDGLSKSPDLSLLRKPIQTSVTGFPQARDVFDTGTEEIRQLLSTECDVIYECRVCRNLFRSLANFISHKRIYCRQKFNTSLHAHFINSKYLKDDMMTILQNEQDYQDFLKNKQYTPEILQAGKESLQKPFTKDLTSVIERLTLKHTSSTDNTRVANNALLKLQPTSHTTQAVYQSVVESTLNQDFMKEQVDEIERLESLQDVTIGPDGKVMTNCVLDEKDLVPVIHISDDDDDDDNIEQSRNIICGICKLKFSTQKTLKFHMKYKHAENKLVYPCPDCAETFANAWGVYRHLFKVHRKSAAYIRKLRESIHNKAFKLQRKTNNDKAPNLDEEMEIISEQHRLDLENQEWMDNLEGDYEVPRCGGCGRKFERRAALSSHRQTCQLRIAAQNKIMTNMQKRQAAKVAGKETPLTQVKLEAEKADVSPAKLPRLETKPIEIQIRRDYHKGPIGSPKRTGTPGSESNGNVSEAGEVNRKGEKGDSIINIHPNIINKHCNETVKDCDDANVVASDANRLVKSLSLSETRDSLASKYSESDGTSSEMDEDDELNFEDIRRICQGNGELSPEMDSIVDTKPLHDQEYAIISSSQDNSETHSQVTECETSFTCNKCNEELTSVDELSDHIKSRHEIIMFQCKFCNYTSREKAEGITHVKAKHRMLGDDERIEKFIKPVSVPLPDNPESDTSDEEVPITASVGSQTIREEVEIDLEVDASQDTDPVPPLSAKENVPSKEEIQSNSSASANCSDVESEIMLAKRKRGRPKKSEKVTKLKPAVQKKTQVQLPLKGSIVSSLNVKKANKAESVPPSPQKSCPIDDVQECNSTNVPTIKKIKMNTSSDTQHSASSMSSTVKRPIRNRVKPLNKDFEYDLSNLLKLEAEAYKESHLPAVIHKQPLKRKPLFQNETISSDLTVSTEVAEQKEQVIEKIYAGSLHSLSLRAADKMKAHMKRVPPMVQRELPPFIAQRRSRPSPQIIPKKDVPVTPPLKMTMEKSSAQQQITPSMIYEKLSSDNSITSLNTDIQSKNEILANMSKVLSSTIKFSPPDESNNLPENKADDQCASFISLKREKDLLCPSRLSKISISEQPSNTTDLNEDSTVNNTASPSPSVSQVNKEVTVPKKSKKDRVEDETIEFVASEKLPFVNILRRRKSIICMNSEKGASDPQDIILTLTSKCYKRKMSKHDAVSLVDVSETKESNSSSSTASDNKVRPDPSTAPSLAESSACIDSLLLKSPQMEDNIIANKLSTSKLSYEQGSELSVNVKSIKEKLSQYLHSGRSDSTDKNC